MAERDQFLHCRMSPAELDLLDQLATKFGVVGRAGIVRHMATHFRNMPAPGIPVPATDPEPPAPKPKRARKA